MELNREKQLIWQAASLKRIFKSKDLLETLPHTIQNSLLETTKNSAEEFYKKVRQEGIKRRVYLTQR